MFEHRPFDRGEGKDVLWQGLDNNQSHHTQSAVQREENNEYPVINHHGNHPAKHNNTDQETMSLFYHFVDADPGPAGGAARHNQRLMPVSCQQNQRCYDQTFNFTQYGITPTSPESETQGADRETEDPQTLAGGDGNAKTVTLSRGFIQMMTEGDFAGGNTDSRKPHFPQDVYKFYRLKEQELEGISPEKRFAGPDEIGRFRQNAQGRHVAARLDRHATATYSQTLPSGEKLGTVGGQSGVTIGLGLDLGNKWGVNDKQKVKDYFVAGEVSVEQAEKLSAAAGVKGIEAAKLAATLRTQVELTDNQVLKVLRAAVSDIDTQIKGFRRGDGTYHPVIEEVIYYSHYWGESKLRAVVTAAAKGKKANEQLDAARDAVAQARDALGKNEKWKYNGYNSIWATLTRLADMIAAGVEIKVSDMVMDKEELKQSDATFTVIQDSCERRDGYEHRGKDLKAQVFQDPIESLISAPVGSGAAAKNEPADVRMIQQLLHQGGYEVDITGEWDDKSSLAAERFMMDRKLKVRSVITPDSKILRTLKEFQYAADAADTEAAPESPTPTGP